VKNKLKGGLDYIIFAIFVSLVSSGFVYLVSFIPFLGPIPNYSYLFWLSFLYLIEIKIIDKLFNLHTNILLIILFVFVYGSGFGFLGLPANNWLALFMLFLSILTASIVQLGYRNFKRGANGKTKDY
jgi:hypothetical protein